MKKFAIAGLFLMTLGLHAQTKPPQAEIHNEQLRVSIYVPGEDQFYKGVRFEHGGWTAANADQRAKFREWPLLLRRFAALADL